MYHVYPGEENASPALLSMRLPVMLGSRTFQEGGSLLASAGIISLLDLSQEPSTACKAGVDTVHLHRPEIREGGHLLPAARLSVDAMDRSGWRTSYRCVLLSICVHHSPKTTQKKRFRASYNINQTRVSNKTSVVIEVGANPVQTNSCTVDKPRRT